MQDYARTARNRLNMVGTGRNRRNMQDQNEPARPRRNRHEYAGTTRINQERAGTRGIKPEKQELEEHAIFGRTGSRRQERHEEVENRVVQEQKREWENRKA
jgi:hypothetical protein